MTKTNKELGYHQCPGVPELMHKCCARLRSRIHCERCEKIIKDGKVTVVRRRRCPGVPAVGHSCNTMTIKPRCRICDGIYNKHQTYLKKISKEKIERVCLKCDRKFIAKNRFLRLCDGCRSVNRSSEHRGMDETRYSISFGGRGG